MFQICQVCLVRITSRWWKTLEYLKSVICEGIRKKASSDPVETYCDRKLQKLSKEARSYEDGTHWSCGTTSNAPTVRNYCHDKLMDDVGISITFFRCNRSTEWMPDCTASGQHLHLRVLLSVCDNQHKQIKCSLRLEGFPTPLTICNSCRFVLSIDCNFHQH